MKNYTLAASLTTMTMSAIANEAISSPHQYSVTATVVSDYIFRGVTQTWGKPALQGSVDYVHSSGLFTSLWGSTVSKKVIAGASTEIDLSVGYKGSINEDWTYGAGLLSVFYSGGNYRKISNGAPTPNQKYNFTEMNAFVGYKWLNIKYSQTVNDLLGFNRETGFSKGTTGSYYLEANADIPLMDTGYTVGLHAGHQDIMADFNGINPDFNDYRISLSKSFDGGWIGALQLTKNTNTAFFNNTPSNRNVSDTRDVGTRRFVVSLTKSF